MKKWSMLLLLAGVTDLGSSAFAQDAVVRVFARRPGGASQGTGFFSSPEGQVVTAYHVVEGATRIEVQHNPLGTFANIRVDLVAPEFDLAVLQILNPVLETPSLQFDLAPDLGAALVLSGFPRGGELQQFRGHATRRAFVSSHTIRDAGGRRLFDGNIDVVPLDLSIYSGMSGGPVIGPRGVVGVLSGSYDEGGGIGWAIPAKYLRSMTAIERKPDEFAWPRLSLMAAAWRSLRAAVRLNLRASEMFDAYVDGAESVLRLLDEMQHQAFTVRLNFMAHRPFLERVIASPALRNDGEAANRLLEPTGRQVSSAFRQLLNLQAEYAETGRGFSVSLANAIAWLTDESKLDYRRGAEIGREARDIRKQISDLRNGLDAYLGINGDALVAASAALIQGLQETGGSAGEQARVQLTFINTWQPAIDKYASPQALMFNARTASALRRLARLFEPIVYQVE
jgi:hypothetical protein